MRVAAPLKALRAALTFDDGPSPWTLPIIDELRRGEAEGTFFVLGCAIAGHEAVLERVASAGCEIGVHGYSHRRLTALSDDEIRDEMGRTAALIVEVTGLMPKWWRAPYLDADDRVRAVCAALALDEAGCTVSTEDYRSATDDVVVRAVAGLRSGAIVLLHDGRAPQDSEADSFVSRAGTVAAVPAIVAAAERQGVRLVTLSALG